MKLVSMGSVLAISLVLIAAGPAAAGGAACSAAFTDRAQLGVGIARDPDGVRIERVEKGRAAEAAGLQVGDVVLEADGAKVADPGDFTRAIRAHKPGDEVRLRVRRDGRELDLSAKLEAWKPGFGHGPGPGHRFAFPAPPPVRLGVNLQPLSEGLRGYFKVPSGRGALVSDVAPGSAAEKAGIRAGDVVLTLNGKDIEDTGDAIDVLRDLKAGDRVTVVLVREGAERSLDAAVEERPAEERQGFFPGMPHGGFEPFDVHVDPRAFEGLGADLEALGPQIEKSLEGLGPDVEKRLEGLGPEIQKRLEGLGPELQQRLEKIGPEIRDRLKRVHRFHASVTI